MSDPRSLPPSFRPMTVASGVKAAGAREPGKIALTMGEQSRTYGELVARIDQATAATLSDLGLKPGQTAAIVARNCLEYVELVCGVPEAGVPVATVNPRLSLTEVVAICDDAQAEVVFADAVWAPQLRAATFATVKRVIALGPEYEAWLLSGDAAAPRPQVQEWDVWTIPYTSGTTGKPKGVAISHRSRVLNFLGMASEYGCYGPDDKFLCIAPMNHGGGLAFTMASIYLGGACDVMDKFEPETVLRKLKFEGVTGIFTVPTHFHAFFALPTEVLAKYGRPPLKAIMSNAAALPQAMKQKIVPYFGEGLLHELYGSTEAGIVTSLRPKDQLRKDRCVGLPFTGNRIKLLNDEGRPCAPGEVGELFAQSPCLFNGYWNRPDETAETFRDGWVTVGDMAVMDEEGFVSIVDRKKDMIISGGVNIYPREIEEVMFTHPDIADVAVIGVPDDQWGERLKAFVVLRPGTSLTPDGLASFCAGRLGAYKVPKDIEIIDLLPRNAAGKVLKTSLRAPA